MLHAAFGNSIVSKFNGASAGRMRVLDVEAQGETSVDLSVTPTFCLVCSKGRGKSFAKPSGRATHEKSCQGAIKDQTLRLAKNDHAAKKPRKTTTRKAATIRMRMNRVQTAKNGWSQKEQRRGAPHALHSFLQGSSARPSEEP